MISKCYTEGNQDSQESVHKL